MPKGSNPKSRANLKKAKHFTVDTASEMGKKGAEVSNARQAQKRTIRQWLEMMGSMKAQPEIVAKMQKMFPAINVSEFTNDGAMAARMYNDAIIKGDARAQREIAEIKGEKIQQQEITIKEPKRFVFEIKK